MKGYLSYFKSELLVMLQYRTAALAGIATQFFWGLIYALVYTAFYQNANIDNINLNELMCYVWLNQAFIMIIYLSIKDSEIQNSIKTGTVAYELCKPYDLYTWWYLKLLAKRYAGSLLRCLPILIVAFILPAPYNLTLPPNIFSLVMFIITLLLGSLLIVAINMIVQTIGFYTLQDKGINGIVYSVGALLSGFFLPLPLMPELFLKLTEYLPFRFIGDLPFRIYSGNIGVQYGIKSMIIQIIWIIILILIGKIFMKFTLKKVSIQGG